MGILSIQTTKDRSNRHEKMVAKRTGGKVTKGSGNQTEKGDVRVRGHLRVECKTTGNLSYRLEESVLAKIMSEANAAGEIGILNIQFEVTGKRYVVIAEDDFEELVSFKGK